MLPVGTSYGDFSYFTHQCCCKYHPVKWVKLDLTLTELQAPQATKTELLEKSLADYLKHDKELIHDLEELGFGKLNFNFGKQK